jgi:hypothetical protein
MGLLGSFFGRDQKKDLQHARAESEAALGQGYNQAQADYTAAENYYQPYADVGKAGIADQNFYSDVLHNRGDAVGQFSSNPLLSGELGSNFMATQRAGNAQGWGAGKEALAGQRVFQQTAGSWLDRYRDNAQQGVNTGLNATNAMAGLRSARGDNAYGYGATKAGNAINYGNAMAANRGTGINNLMGLAGTVVSGINAFRKPNLGS